jgi:hypothetical protein
MLTPKHVASTYSFTDENVYFGAIGEEKLAFMMRFHKIKAPSKCSAMKSCARSLMC